MSTSNYQDFTSFVSGSGKADDYTMLQNYTATGNSQAAPLQSVLKLSVAPGSDKYFSVAPSFQSRLDNFRIAPPAMTPIGLTDGNASSSNATMQSVEGGNFAASGEYARLGQTYKLNPN
ncbi:MAG: hypothetical protein PHG66_01825 [Candidatus Colwellbacteria bacterium]|nr:hypothetical protein [Candidatus Colwellbacteria bacterium]